MIITSNHSNDTQQLLAAIEHAVSEPVPLVQSLPENFWQQIETLAISEHDD